MKTARHILDINLSYYHCDNMIEKGTRIEEPVLKAMEEYAQEQRLTDEDIIFLKELKGYFGLHDKSPFEHYAYAQLDSLVKKQTA